MMRASQIAGLSAAMALAACAPSPAQPGGGGGGAPETYADNLVQLARMDGSTFVEILEVRARDDGWVLFCSGVRGLNVVDARDPAAPERVWSLASSLGSAQYPRCQHLTWAGERLYLTNRGDEIQPTPFVTAFDAPDLATQQPIEGPSFTQPGLSFEGIAAAGEHLFVAAHETGVLVLRDSGSSLDALGTLTGLNNAWAVATDDERLYIADGPGGLAIADVSNPAAPNLLSQLDIGGSAQHIALDPDRALAYLAAGSAGVIAVDVSDPTAPVLLSRSDTPGTSLQVSLAAGHAYVADWNDVRVLDVADPSAPVLVAVENIPVFPGFARVLGVAARKDAVFMGEWTGLYSYRFTPGLPAPDIRIARDVIDLGAAAIGETQAAAIIAENEGQRPLVIHAVDTKGNGMTLHTPLPITLQPGQQAAIEIQRQNDSAEESFASALLWSDDPDEPGRSIGLVTNASGLGIGDMAPEVEVSLLDGGQWSLDAQIGDVVVLSYFATF